MEDKRKQKYKLIIFGIIWACVLILVLAVAYFIPGVSNALNSTYVAEYDNVYVSDKVKCYLIKDEQISYSTCSGTAGYLIEDKTHIRKYTTVMNVGSTSFTSDKAGTLSYSADGYETYFIKDNLSDITEDYVKSLDIKCNKLAKEEIMKGDPIFKIVNDKEWYMIFWIDIDSINKYTKGNEVSVIISKNTKLEATVDDILDQGDRYMVVLKIGNYYESLAETRVLDAEVVTVDESGLLIKQKSIVTLNGTPGVYVKQLNGQFEFVRVRILSLADDNAIVSAGSFSEVDGEVTNRIDTINCYDEILTNAKSLDEGGE